MQRPLALISSHHLNRAGRRARNYWQLCLPFNLSVTELRTDCTSADVEIVRELTAADGRITVAVIGYFCKTVSRVLSITSPERLGLVKISLNSHADMDKANSQYYRMLPSTSVYAEALSQLMARVKWTRIAVVLTQAPNSYSFEMAKVVMQILQDKGFEPVVTVQISDDKNSCTRKTLSHECNQAITHFRR